MIRRTEALKRAVLYCAPEKGSSCPAGQDEEVPEESSCGRVPTGGNRQEMQWSQVRWSEVKLGKEK
jgi:hypothetical protein